MPLLSGNLFRRLGNPERQILCIGKTFANRIYHQLNHDLVKTQRAMGHKNINSAVAYLSFVEDEIDAAILAS